MRTLRYFVLTNAVIVYVAGHQESSFLPPSIIFGSSVSDICFGIEGRRQWANGHVLPEFRWSVILSLTTGRFDFENRRCSEAMGAFL
jgi:hypothetical protein